MKIQLNNITSSYSKLIHQETRKKTGKNGKTVLIS